MNPSVVYNAPAYVTWQRKQCCSYSGLGMHPSAFNKRLGGAGQGAPLLRHHKGPFAWFVKHSIRRIPEFKGRPAETERTLDRLPVNVGLLYLGQFKAILNHFVVIMGSFFGVIFWSFLGLFFGSLFGNFLDHFWVPFWG